MFELMICSLLTILPRLSLPTAMPQNKRFGQEITFLFGSGTSSDWGIVGCLMLTISLITMIFYFHPLDPPAPRCSSGRVPILPRRLRDVWREVNGSGFSAGRSPRET